MRGQLIGKLRKRGVGTIEILIAFALLMSALTFASLLWFSDQSLIIDTKNSTSAKEKVGDYLEELRFSIGQFDVLRATSTIIKDEELSFVKILSPKEISPCSKQVRSSVSWKTDIRDQSVSLETLFVNLTQSISLGFDCPGKTPPGNWQNPTVFATDSSRLENLTSIDALNEFVYVGSSLPPYLLVGQIGPLVEGQTTGIFLPPTNGFTLEARIQDLDAILWKDPITGNRKKYVFAAVASSTKQLAVIDVTDESAPVVVVRRQLVNVNPNGSQPYGYRIYYYDEKLYVLTRETAGPEFHIFNVSNPQNPIEIGPGTKLTGPTPPNGTTVNDLTVKNDIVFMAAEKNASELLIYDVANPVSPTFLANATVDLPGTQNGSSIFAIGSLLFLGRENNTAGPELYVFDISNTKEAVSGLPLIGSLEIGADVKKILVTNSLAFLAINKSKNELQVWDVGDLSNIKNLSKKDAGTITHGGLDFDDEFLYLAGENNAGISIFHGSQ